MSNYDYILKVDDQIYQFNNIEEDPLRYIMKLTDNSYLIRDINCDQPTEKWQIVSKFIAIKDGEEVPEVHTDIVYHGKDITDLNLLDTLLRHVLTGVVIPLDY